MFASVGIINYDLAMDITCIEKILKGRKELRFRHEQAFSAVFKDLIEDWSLAGVFTKDLRKDLIEKCSLEIAAEASVSKEGDAVKARITLRDKARVETVLMRHGDGRNTVCVSSQAGCPLGCVFCATGKMGFKRNLTKWEIVEQVLFFARYLKKERQSVSNVVFMGMGEPFLNYESVLGAIRVLNDKKFFNIGARGISISTAGIIEGIEKFSDENLQVNLALSLHAPTDELRSKIMPINDKYSLEKVLAAVDKYIDKTNRKVMIEYILMDGINDSDECAEKLAKLVKKPLYFVNIILYNPVSFEASAEEGDIKPSPKERVKKFKEILAAHGVNFSERRRFGQDIKGACGQFAA